MKVDVYRLNKTGAYVYYYLKNQSPVLFDWEIGFKAVFKVAPNMKGKGVPYASVEVILSNAVKSKKAWEGSIPSFSELDRVTFRPYQGDMFFLVRTGDVIQKADVVFFTPQGLFIKKWD